MFALTDKIAFVTGAASGIGQSISEVFARAGAFVFVADQEAKGGAETVHRIEKAGGEAEFVSLDVTNEDQCDAVAAHVHGTKGHLDILVNNAGVGHVGTILQTSGADMDRLYSVNVRGIFNLSKAFLPEMLKRKSGQHCVCFRKQ